MAGDERLQVSRGQAGEVVVSGEIDLASSRILRHVLDERAKTPGVDLVVDLREVRYLGSAGVAVLYDHAESGNLRLLVRADTAVAVVIRICGLAQVASVELLQAAGEPD